jgi:hypothetical protein
MGSSFDYEFAGPIASEAVNDEFEIDLTFDDPMLAQNPDAEMGDSDENFHADLKDHPDELMVENHNETINFEYTADNDSLTQTPRIATPGILSGSLDVGNANANAASTLSPSKSLLLDDNMVAADEMAAATENGSAEDEADNIALLGPLEEEYEGAFDGHEEAVEELEGAEDYSHASLHGEYVDDDHVIFGPDDAETQASEQRHLSNNENPFPTTTADAALEFISQEDTTANVLNYQATVQWQDSTVPLFPNPSVQSRYFSTDLSLLNKDIANFFKASRDILKSQVGDDYILELNIPQLELAIDEVSLPFVSV